MKPAARTQGSRDSYGRLSPLWIFLLRYGPPRWSEYVVQKWTGQRLVIAVPYLWLLIFFLVPFLIVLKISFAEFSPLGRPPYEPVFQWLEEGALQIKLLIGSYVYLFNEPLYVSAWFYSLKVAFFSTVFCLALGYPMAYAIARSPPTQRNVLLLLIILPFWTSFLLRVYAWVGLLKTDGAHQPGVVQVVRPRRRAAGDDEHQFRGVHRHRLFLPAVHDPAAVLQPREARQHAARGRAGPGRRPDQVIPARDAAAVVPRHRRRLAAGVHPGGG